MDLSSTGSYLCPQGLDCTFSNSCPAEDTICPPGFICSRASEINDPSVILHNSHVQVGDFIIASCPKDYYCPRFNEVEACPQGHWCAEFSAQPHGKQG